MQINNPQNVYAWANYNHLELPSDPSLESSSFFTVPCQAHSEHAGNRDTCGF